MASVSARIGTVLETVRQESTDEVSYHQKIGRVLDTVIKQRTGQPFERHEPTTSSEAGLAYELFYALAGAASDETREQVQALFGR